MLLEHRSLHGEPSCPVLSFDPPCVCVLFLQYPSYLINVLLFTTWEAARWGTEDLIQEVWVRRIKERFTKESSIGFRNGLITKILRTRYFLCNFRYYHLWWTSLLILLVKLSIKVLFIFNIPTLYLLVRNCLFSIVKLFCNIHMNFNDFRKSLM